MAAFAVRAVKSVLAQTYKNIEIIFVDDGSADDTRVQLEQFGDKITYIYKQNGGVCSARNVGLRAAKGEYIGLLDSDDVYMPDKVEACLKFLRENPAFGFVHTDIEFIDRSGKVLGRQDHPMSRHTGWITRYLLMRNFIANPTNFFKRECIERCGYYNEALFPPGDWDLWLRISRHFQMGYIDRPLSQYSVLSNSCFNDLERTRREEKDVLDRFFQEDRRFDGAIKRRAYSEFHLRTAQCYLLKGNHERCRQEMSAALKASPENLRSWAFIAYYSLARASLTAQLRRRIIRYEPEQREYGAGHC